MKILVLGGTGWLGSHVARLALQQGHAVTCVSRGTMHQPAGRPHTSHANARINGARFVFADRDHDDALAPLAREHWDAVIDVTSQPRHVRRAVRDLEGAADTYVYVSSISVYETNTEPGADESAGRVNALASDVCDSPADYPGAKVACEDAALAGFGKGRAVIARPGLIGGPGDHTGRTTYWPWRFAHPSSAAGVVVPDQPDLVTAMIDVRDLAAWLVAAAAKALSGTFNLLGERHTLAEHLDLAREVATAEGGTHADGPTSIAMAKDFLLDHDVNPWAGENSLPLWLPDDAMLAMNDRSTVAALAAGLELRPLADTLRDGSWWRSNNGGVAGLGDEAERNLVKAWRQR